VLGEQMFGFPLPDVALVAEHADPLNMGRLLQLILGCAVKCERKQEYIEAIMTLEESVQHVVMTAIQELMSKESVGHFGSEPPGNLEQQLQTFHTPSSCSSLTELTNGEAMSQALHHIDSAWFSNIWLGRIKTDVGDNWRLKMNNLKKILQMMVDYYNEMWRWWLSTPTRSTWAGCYSFILGCAVKCERKQEYIEAIMTLEESVQHVVMTAIQELMSKESVGHFGSEPPGNLEQQLRKTVENLASLSADTEELQQRCHELDVQVTILQEERNSLLAENDVLTDRANQLGSFDDPSTPSGRKHSQLQLQLEALQEEIFRLEAAKDDYRLHCEELERQLVEVQHRNDVLVGLAEESRALRDELDVLRSCSDRAVKLEASVETYRRRLEDLSDLRRQVKQLEDKNTTYMQNTVQVLHKKLSDETRRADNLAFNMKKCDEKYEALTKEKERLIIERDSLKETNEELRCTQAQQNHLLQAGMFPGSPTHENLEAEMIPIEHREKFIRLQHENKMLRVQQEELETEKIIDLQAQLEESHRTRSQLDTDNRLSLERLLELQQQVEDLQKALQSQAAQPDHGAA
ncbi:hypothetical protein CRUP_014755, partial [Coryphaenoides rupestris]